MRYEVNGVIRYAANVSCEVEADNQQEAKEKAIAEFEEMMHSEFPEYVDMIIDKPIKIKE